MPRSNNHSILGALHISTPLAHHTLPHFLNMWGGETAHVARDKAPVEPLMPCPGEGLAVRASRFGFRAGEGAGRAQWQFFEEGVQG